MDCHNLGHPNVDSYAKTFLILYPSLENSTTPIAITLSISRLIDVNQPKDGLPLNLIRLVTLMLLVASCITTFGGAFI